MSTPAARGAVSRLPSLCAPSSSSAVAGSAVHRRSFTSQRPSIPLKRAEVPATSSSAVAASSRTLVTLSRSQCPPTAAPCHSCGQRNFTSSASRSASTKDPYSVLGVKKNADVKDIKKAYYSLAKKYHPDTNKEKGSKERFVEIQNAYALLSDDKKRAAYDQYGTTDDQPGFDPFGGAGSSPFGAGGFGGFQDFGGFSNAGNAGSIFESLFGAFGGAARPGQRGPGFGAAGFAGEAQGEDLETTINLTFEEACKGTKRKVVINPIERCGTCTGSGLKPGAKKSTCGTCNGTGTRTFVIQSGFQMATTCPSCGGAGSTVAPGDNCNTCDGIGRLRGRKEVEIDLPAGVDDGFRIRKDGFGDVPLSGAGTPGSLYVRINVASSRIWRRQGSTLFFPATIPFHTAILGGKVRVPTLEGPVEVRVPAGTQVGEQMVLPNRGVPSPTRRGQKGDLMVQFEVTMPRSLTKRQREILQQYADEVEGRTWAPSDSSNASSSAGASNAKTTKAASSWTASGAKASTNETSSSASSTSTKASSTFPRHAQTGSAEPTTKKTATGRFSIHPSSRSDDASSAAPSSAPASASTRKPETKSSGATEGSASQATWSRTAQDESQKGFLGRTWDWMTNRK
ncbi:hypothetical protein NDA10_004429 [Ustilago hordei]|nr:hypothetical protein NDA10_004429 [Ustilago hordei]UTT91440.1 hypothetical protein NDA17_005899 [Ustilago hordei]